LCNLKKNEILKHGDKKNYHENLLKSKKGGGGTKGGGTIRIDSRLAHEFGGHFLAVDGAVVERGAGA